MKMVFRPVSKGDLKRLNQIINDKDNSRHLNLIPPTSMDSTDKFFVKCKQDGLMWIAIVVDEVVAGSYSIAVGDKGSKSAHCATVGICIDKEFWGTGLSDKAFRHMISWSRNNKIKRLELVVERGNIRAQKVYLRHGFELEGIKRKAVKFTGRFEDMLLMGKLL